KVVALTGTGTTAIINVTDVSFGTVDDGTTSASMDIAVTNKATMSRGVLHVSSASITGSAAASFLFGNTLGCTGGNSCTFSPALDITSGTVNVPVLCSPQGAATGTLSASVVFTSDTDAGGDATAALTCVAGHPQISVSTDTLAFANVAVGQSPTLP